MAIRMNRRQWLKTGAVVALGTAAEWNFSSCGKGDIIPLRRGSGDPLRLHSNESPYGLSPAAREAFVKAADRANLYPHRNYQELITALAERENIPEENIILGAGSTGVMTTLIHLNGTGGTILTADPTYFDFVNYAEKTGCPLDMIPLNEKQEHDLERMKIRLTANTSMVYICNPNNPTGSITPGERLESFCRGISEKALVIVDEAYHEYVEDPAHRSMIGLVRKGYNIIVLRTFSKIYGMAGLRVGYGIARPDIIERLARIERNFAPVAYPSLMAALAGYKDGNFTRMIREKNRSVRAYLSTQLEKRGIPCIPSHTNFVFARINRDSRETAQELEARGILVRPFSYRGGDWVRITLGTIEQMHSFVPVFAALT